MFNVKKNFQSYTITINTEEDEYLLEKVIEKHLSSFRRDSSFFNRKDTMSEKQSIEFHHLKSLLEAMNPRKYIGYRW
jgi:hypothetical protein